jgi:DNA-binding GntR family transcriptional regulator
VKQALALTTRSESGRTTSTSLVDAAYQALKSAIRENVFPPGYQAAEPDIAKQLGMSRTPVHEAIIRLQEEGLVQVLSRRGVLVCGISTDDIREIYDVLIAIEGMAASLLASLPKDAALGVLKALEHETNHMESAMQSGDLLAWAAADERFHQLLTERCGNRRLARMAATVMDQSHRARIFTLRLRPLPTTSATEHRQIIAAIHDGNAFEAETLAKSHRIRARDALLPTLHSTECGICNLDWCTDTLCIFLSVIAAPAHRAVSIYELNEFTQETDVPQEELTRINSQHRAGAGGR